MTDYLRICEKAAREAGYVLLEMQGRVTVAEKGPADLVTPADLAAQETVRRILSEAFPSHGLVGEEDKPGNALENQPEYFWIVDPLDGTTNYVHGVPHFCVSLALARGGELLVGTIFDPNTEKCFSAERGQGAALNGSRLRTSAVERLAQAVVAIGFPPVVTPASPDLVTFNAAVVACQSMRRTGSAALNLAYVAAGWFDAAWAYGCKVWDLAAGTLLIREAGGRVADMAGQDRPLGHGPYLAAANSKLLAEAQSLIARSGAKAE